MKKTFLFIFAFLVNIVFVNAQEELAMVKDNDQFGYINKAGDMVIKPQFPKAGDFSEGYAAAMENKKWGFRCPQLYQGNRETVYERESSCSERYSFLR